MNSSKRKRLEMVRKSFYCKKLTMEERQPGICTQETKISKNLRRHYDKHFTKKFSEAYRKYIQGDWATAEDLLSQCLKMNPKDGPTLTLKGVIEEHNGRSPNNWKGFRELTEK